MKTNEVYIIECFAIKLGLAKNQLQEAKNIIGMLGFKETCNELDLVIKDLEKSISKANNFVKENTNDKKDDI